MKIVKTIAVSLIALFLSNCASSNKSSKIDENTSTIHLGGTQWISECIEVDGASMTSLLIFESDFSFRQKLSKFPDRECKGISSDVVLVFSYEIGEKMTADHQTYMFKSKLLYTYPTQYDVATGGEYHNMLKYSSNQIIFGNIPSSDEPKIIDLDVYQRVK